MLWEGVKHIVVIGGGTGTCTVLSGLKKFPVGALSLSAIISVSDSGGSTGRLRDEFGVLPLGDFRMALTALSDEQNENLLRELFFCIDLIKGKDCRDIILVIYFSLP